MTFRPANRKFFPQLIVTEKWHNKTKTGESEPRKNRNEMAQSLNRLYLWGFRGWWDKGATGDMVGQGRPLKVNPVQEACPNRDNIWIFINLPQTCRSIPLFIGAVIVYFVSVLFFLFLPQLFFCIIIFCVKLFCSSTHTLSKNSVPVTEKNCLCRLLVQPCRRLWLFFGGAYLPDTIEHALPVCWLI